MFGSFFTIQTFSKNNLFTKSQVIQICSYVIDVAIKKNHKKKSPIFCHTGQSKNVFEALQVFSNCFPNNYAPILSYFTHFINISNK